MPAPENLISTTELCRRMGVTVRVETLLRLGLMPMQMLPQGTLWAETDYEEICVILAKHLADGGDLYGFPAF